MPEELEESKGSPEPETDYTAADALKELYPEEPEAEATETEPEEETEEQPADEGSEDDEIEVPALHEDVLATLKEHNPEAIKSWENNWKGLNKREQRVSAIEAQYKALGESPEKARTELTGFIQGLAQHFGTTPEELMGWKATTPEPTAPDEEMEFYSDAERVAYEKATAAEKRAMDLEARLSRFEKQQEDARVRAEQEAFVDSVAPRVAKQAEKSYSGFKVTREMVAEALRSFPQLKDAPMEAVAAKYAKELFAHAAKSSRELSAKRGPDMLPKVTGRGAAVKSAEDYSAFDAYKELVERT